MDLGGPGRCSGLRHSLSMAEAEGLDVVGGSPVAHPDLLVAVGCDDEPVVWRNDLEGGTQREGQVRVPAPQVDVLIRAEGSSGFWFSSAQLMLHDLQRLPS